MNAYDALFWYTGLIPWIAISIILALSVAVSCMIAVAQAYRRTRSWVFIWIATRYGISKEEHERLFRILRRVPELPSGIDTVLEEAVKIMKQDKP